MILVGAVTSVSAREPSIPAGCPAVSVHGPAAQTTGPMTAERTASDILVAEGRAATRTMSGESVARGIALYQQAVRADTTNPEAYVLLARMHAQSQRYLSVPKKLAQARAWENLSRGRALDPSNIDGLHLLADRVVATKGDYTCAKTILEAALTLDPLAEPAQQLRVVVVGPCVSRPRYMAGRYDWVLTTYLASTPDAPLAHFYRSLAYGRRACSRKPSTKRQRFRRSTAVVMPEVSA